MEHLFAEVQLRGISYFLVDSEWYQIKDAFIDKLNRHCSFFAKTERYKGSLKRWDFESVREEGDYNRSHLGQPNTLVFDRVTPDNIEACDILQWDSDRLYFIHVKKGFDKTVRELTSQVLIAAKRLYADKVDGGDYFMKLLHRVRGSDGYDDLKGQLAGFDETSFASLIRERRLSFVFAILEDSVGESKRLENMAQFRSNIAKFSLHSLIQEMRGMGVELLIYEIERT